MREQRDKVGEINKRLNMNMERSQYGLDKLQVQLTTLKKQSDVRLSEMKKQAKQDAEDGEIKETDTP